MRRPRVSLHTVLRAFDEAEFGLGNILNLRESLPSPADARFRADAWLRERQMNGATEVLVITGRGNKSPNGVSAVREAVLSSMPSLRRRGVVIEWKEHSPGSFVIKLGSIKSLLDAPRRRRDQREKMQVANPDSLSNLEPTTIDMLRQLALRSLESLGVRDPDKFVESEMVTKFNSLAGSITPGIDGEARLRTALKVALEQLDE